MHRLRSTSRRPKRSRLFGRALAVTSVAAALAVAAFLMFRADPASDEAIETSVATSEPQAVETSAPAETAAVQSPADAVPAPSRGGHVTVALVGERGTFNALLTGADRSIAALHHLVGAAAFRLDPITHDLVPGVMSRVPDVAGAGLTVNANGTMTVRAEISPDAYWSDGKKLTGSDFTHTLTLIEAHREAIHPDVVAAHDLIVPGSLAVSASTVEYTLAQPTLAIHEPFAVLVPAHAAPVESFLTDWSDQPWLSAGPFVVTAVEGQAIELAPNPEYRTAGSDGERLPRLDGLSVVFHGTEASAAAAFSSGSVDVVGTITTPDLVESLGGVDGATPIVLRGPGWEQMSFQFGAGALDVNPASVVDRVVIRRAIMSVIDRQAIAEAVQGSVGQPIDSIIAIGWPGIADPIWEAPEPRPGVLTGVTVTLATTGGNQDRQVVVQMIRDQLESVGATVVVETDEAGRFFGDMVLPGQFEVAEWAWVSEPGPAGTMDDFLSWFTTTGSQQLDFANWSASDDAGDFGVAVTGIDGLLNIDDLEARLLAAERALYDQVPLIPLYADLNAGAALGHVLGFSHSALPGGILATAADWYAIEE